ncbi:MAG: hypothetical protein ACFFDP_11235 [Promethearchaeota archaeon]
MGEERSTAGGPDVVQWAKRWQPKWAPNIIFPHNPFLNGIFEYIRRNANLDATYIDEGHQFQMRTEHAYDPDELSYDVRLNELNSTLRIVPYKPDYGRSFVRSLRKRQFINQAKELESYALELIERMPNEQRGHQIRPISEVLKMLNFPSDALEIAQETLFGNPDPTRYRYLSNPVSFINLQNGWIIVPHKDSKLKMNLGVEYEHVFRLSYRFERAAGPVVEDYHKYQMALGQLSRQTVRRVFSNLGEYTSIMHNPFFYRSITDQYPVRYVALNNGLLVAALGEGAILEHGTFEFYQVTERRSSSAEGQ